MKIALIFPQNQFSCQISTLKAQEKNMGVFPPLSLAYVAAVIEKEEHEVCIIDNNALHLDNQELIHKIKNFSPDILGFTVTTYTWHETVNCINFLKQKINIPVILGGHHVSFYPQETISHPAIDYALMGEAHETLPNFLKALKNQTSFADVPGLCYKKENKTFINQIPLEEGSADDIPFPARHLLDNEKYFSFISRRKNFTAFITTFGCPFKCIFCSVNRTKFRVRSAQNIVEELEQCYHNHHIREFDIYDASFSIDKERTLKICQGIKEKKLKIDWSVRTRIDLVDKKLLQTMADAGCYFSMYGIETLSPEIQKNLKKNIDLKQLRQVLKWTQQAGIQTLGFFMFGSPGETISTIEQTIRSSTKLGLDHVQFTRLTPFPNTDLYDSYRLKYHEDYWKNFLIGKTQPKILPLVGTDLKPEIIEKYIRKAYLSFYLRPLHLLKLFYKIKSMTQIKKYIRAGLSMLFSLK